MISRLLFLLVAVLVFVGCSNTPENSKEIKTLNQLLVDESASISELTNELSKAESDLAAELIHDHLSAKLKSEFKEQWENETLVLGDYQLKFKNKKFGEKPAQGWSLYISMHGGGGAPAAVNDQQWENQKRLYEPAEGIYMAPRAPTDSWNLWHQSHIDEFFARFIELADAFEDINTNRVYITGYSAGGDGTYQLAPRMADWFAGAAMMAGHPNDASPLGLRNLPFAVQMGAEDGAYDRNKIAANWGEKLDKLQEQDPQGYEHFVNLYEGMGHWMERKDTAAFNWMGQFNRKSYPEKVVWKQSGVTHNRFYWLAVPEGKAVKGAEVVASFEGQTVKIEEAKDVKELVVRLNDQMMDLNKKVRVEYNENVVYNDIPTRNISTIWKSLNEKNDLEQVFSAEIKLTLDN